LEILRTLGILKYSLKEDRGFACFGKTKILNRGSFSLPEREKNHKHKLDTEVIQILKDFKQSLRTSEFLLSKAKAEAKQIFLVVKAL
jgi:hypothetical protein